MGAILFIILFVGLNPKNIHSLNHVDWLMDPAGIHFGETALAYTGNLSTLAENIISAQNGFTIEIALKPNNFHQDGFKFILSAHGGRDSEQLLVAQWRSSFILMNGDDYNHRRRTKRLAVKTSFNRPVTQFVTIATGKDGTRVYFNGRLVGKRKNFTLKMPHGEITRLLLANSVYGRHPWQGDVYGLALYGRSISETDAKQHFREWTETPHFSFAKKYDPSVLYYFDEKKGHRVADYGHAANHLTVPSKLTVLKPEFFFNRFNEPNLSENFLKDVALNFFGFLPFGIILAAVFIRLGNVFETQSVLLTLISGLALSLFIEVNQAWMLTRSSDLLDIILNTLGAMVGATILRYIDNTLSPNVSLE